MSRLKNQRSSALYAVYIQIQESLAKYVGNQKCYCDENQIINTIYLESQFLKANRTMICALDWRRIC